MEGSKQKHIRFSDGPVVDLSVSITIETLTTIPRAFEQEGESPGPIATIGHFHARGEGIYLAE